MARPDPPPDAQARVLVAGGGVAALEVLLALHERTAGTIRATLLAPERSLRYRPLAAYVGLVPDVAHPLDLTSTAVERGAGHVRARLVRVEADDGQVWTDDAGVIGYDALVVAVGATARVGTPGAVTLGLPADEPALARLIDEVRSGAVGRLTVVVPPGTAWSLPAYELALLLERTAPASTRVAVVTGESTPLEAFGPEVGAAIAALLDRRGIGLLTGTSPELVADGGPWTSAAGAADGDAVVSLARPQGPAIPGLPCDAGGFLPVGPGGLVTGESWIWAAGDAAAHPAKQGGLAIQQADAVVEQIARRLGMEHRLVAVPPRRPVLRAALLDGEGTLYLRVEPVDGGGWSTEVSREPLWWPPTKIAGGRLPAYLAERELAAEG